MNDEVTITVSRRDLEQVIAYPGPGCAHAAARISEVLTTPAVEPVWRSPLPDRCANLECTNKPGEGTFELLRTIKQVVGGVRPLALWVCAPCARDVTRLTTR